MKRIRTCLYAAILSLLILQTGIVHALPANTTAKKTASDYDPLVLPISDSTLHNMLIKDANNSELEYGDLLRATYQQHAKTAYETMSQLLQAQPQNPIVLDGYFMAYKMAVGDFSQSCRRMQKLILQRSKF